VVCGRKPARENVLFTASVLPPWHPLRTDKAKTKPA